MAFFFKAYISDCSAPHFWEHGRDETTPAPVDVAQGTGGGTGSRLQSFRRESTKTGALLYLVNWFRYVSEIGAEDRTMKWQMKSEWKRRERLWRNEKWEIGQENNRKGTNEKREKNIYYAIRFHAGKHSIPSSLQLTIPLFRRNSPHSPQHMKGRVDGGRASSALLRLHCSFPGSSARSLHFGFGMRNLQDWMGYLYLNIDDPNPRGLLSRHSWYPTEKILQFPSVAHFQHSSSTFLYRSSTLLSVLSHHHHLPVDQLSLCSSGNTMTISSPERISYHFCCISPSDKQAGPQAWGPL